MDNHRGKPLTGKELSSLKGSRTNARERRLIATVEAAWEVLAQCQPTKDEVDEARGRPQVIVLMCPDGGAEIYASDGVRVKVETLRTPEQLVEVTEKMKPDMKLKETGFPAFLRRPNLPASAWKELFEEWVQEQVAAGVNIQAIVKAIAKGQP